MTKNQGTTHTAIDDLESFLWVLFWSILEVIHIHGKPTSMELFSIKVMTSHDLALLNGQGRLLELVGLQLKLNTASPVIAAFGPILVAWSKVAEDAELALARQRETRTDDELFEDTKSVCSRYIKIGFDHLANLATTWDDLFPIAALPANGN
jgi:hypothetical protein